MSVDESIILELLQGSTIPGPLRSPFANPVILIFSPWEIMSTPEENIDIRPFFWKRSVLNREQTC